MCSRAWGRNPYDAPKRRHDQQAPPMTAPSMLGDTWGMGGHLGQTRVPGIASKWATTMSYSSTVRSRNTTFGTQLDARLPTAQSHTFSSMKRNMLANVHRFALLPVLYVEKEVAKLYNLGREGQGPASYKIGATVAATTFDSRKANAPKATFGNAPRFGYTRFSRLPYSGDHEYTAETQYRIGPGPNRYDT